MDVFIVFWSCLFTTKLRSVITHNLGHSNIAGSTSQSRTVYKEIIEFQNRNTVNLTINIKWLCATKARWLQSNTVVCWQIIAPLCQSSFHENARIAQNNRLVFCTPLCIILSKKNIRQKCTTEIYTCHFKTTFFFTRVPPCLSPCCTTAHWASTYWSSTQFVFFKKAQKKDEMLI